MDHVRGDKLVITRAEFDCLEDSEVVRGEIPHMRCVKLHFGVCTSLVDDDYRVGEELILNFFYFFYGRKKPHQKIGSSYQPTLERVSGATIFA